MYNIAVVRHDLRVKCVELALAFTQAQHSGRFSAQTRSQQHLIQRVIQTRGGAAECSRQRQEVTY